MNQQQRVGGPCTDEDVFRDAAVPNESPRVRGEWIMRRIIAMAALVMLVGACEKGPGGYDPKTITKDFRASDYRTIETGQSAGVAIAVVHYDVPEITAEVMEDGAVEAYIDLGTGNVWYALPWAIQLPDRTAVTIGYAYQEKVFAVTLTSPSAAAVEAVVSVAAPYQLKVVITTPS